MKKAVSVFLSENITRKDLLYLIDWMSNEHVIKYLDKSQNAKEELKNLLKYSDESIFRNNYKCNGYFYLIRQRNKVIGFVKLIEKYKSNFELVYCIGYEELWGQGLGTKALKRAMYNIFLLHRGQSITALVHKDNIRSIQSLNKCRFNKTDETGEYIKYSITMSEYLSALKNR